MAKKISDLSATTLQSGDEFEIYRLSAPTSDLRAPLDDDALRTIIGPATEDEMGLIGPLTGSPDDVLRGDGTIGPAVPGGLTTEVNSAGVPIAIGNSLDGVHKRFGVATALTLQPDAEVGTRVAVTPASTGTSTVTVGSGAVYRLPPTDGPAATGRFAPFDLVDYTEFEVIANSNGVSAEWDVWGIPAGAETTLVGPIDLNAQTIIPGAPVQVAGARTYAAGDSGKTFAVTEAGTQTIPVGLPAGWEVTIWNQSGSAFNITRTTSVSLAAQEVATVKVVVASPYAVRVAKGATTQIS